MTNVGSIPEVYIIEDQALDLSVHTGNSPLNKQDVALDLSLGTSGKRLKPNQKLGPRILTKKRRSSAKDMDYIVKFGNYGLAGAPQTKRQMSLLLKKKEEEEKAKKCGGIDVDPSKQHSMEDLVHAKILISLKSSTNEDEEEESKVMETEEEVDVTDEKKGEISKVKSEGAVEMEIESRTEDAEADKMKTEQKDDKLETGNKKEIKENSKPVIEEGDNKKKVEEKYECKKCSKEFKDAAAVAVHNAEHKQEYMCRMCHFIFEQKDTYVTHLESHFPPIEVSSESGKQTGKRLKCEICNQSGFQSAKSLEVHKSTHYTVIPMKMGGDKEPMTLVVHPSGSLVVSNLKDGKETTQKTVKSKKATAAATKAGEGEKTESEEISKASSSEKVNTKKVVGENKSPGTDSVDGMNVTQVKDSKERAGKGKGSVENKPDESQLPAFSEIVRDVDEFFIKEVKPEKKSLDDDVDHIVTCPDMSTEVEVTEEKDNHDTDESIDYSEIDKPDADETEHTHSKTENACMICNKQFSGDAYFEHMMLHSVYELATSKMSMEKKEVVESTHETDSSNPTVFGCGLCKENYNSFDELKKHVSKHVPKSQLKGLCGEGHKKDDSKKKEDASKKGRKRRVPIGAADVIHKLPKIEKTSNSASILAAALKTGPKFNVAAALSGKAQSTENVHTVTGDHKAAQEKMDIYVNTDDSVKTLGPAAVNIGKASVKEVLNFPTSAVNIDPATSTTTSSSPQVVTVLAPGLVQNFASKLLVQGMQTFLVNSNQAPMKGMIASTPTATVQVRPPQAVRVVNQALPGSKPTAPSTPLNSLRLVSSNRTSSTLQEVIVLKPGMGVGAVPVQVISSSKDQTHQSTVTDSLGAQKNAMPLNISLQAVPPTSVALSTTIQSHTIQLPASLQTATKIAVPFSVFQNMSGLNMSASSTLSPTQTLTLGSGGSVHMPVATTLPVVKAVPLTTSASKINPAIQTNLLNMVLARMSQPVVSGSPTGTPITFNLASANAAIGQTGPRVSSVITSPSAAQYSSPANLNLTGPLFLCGQCKKQGTKSEMFIHVCTAKTPVAQVTLTPSTGSSTGLATSSIGSFVPQTKKMGVKEDDNSLPTAPEEVDEKGAAHAVPEALVDEFGETVLLEDAGKVHGKKYFLNIYECAKCRFTTMKKKVAEKHMAKAHKSKLHECKYDQSKHQLQSSTGKVGHSLECSECGLFMNTMETSQPVGVLETSGSHGVTLLTFTDSAGSDTTLATDVDGSEVKAELEQDLDTAETDDKMEEEEEGEGSIMYRCPKCKYWLVSELEGARHMEYKHLVDKHECEFQKCDQQMTCQICGLIKVFKSSEKGSKKTETIADTINTENSKAESEDETEKVAKVSYRCRNCGLVFETLFKLKQHKVIRHGRLGGPKRHAKVVVQGTWQKESRGKVKAGMLGKRLQRQTAAKNKTDTIEDTKLREETIVESFSSTSAAERDESCAIENC